LHGLYSHSRFNESLEIGHLPDMTFARNLLRVRHDDGFGIEFTAMDALKEVRQRCEELVHASDEWRRAREEHREAQLINQNFDWTFTTEYAGSLLPLETKVTFPTGRTIESVRNVNVERIPAADSSDSNADQSIQVQPSPFAIDLDKLRVREEIVFFDEIDLFEDELADNGVSNLTVRIVSLPRSSALTSVRSVHNNYPVLSFSNLSE
jgi:type 2A phosphatase activator TIP41